MFNKVFEKKKWCIKINDYLFRDRLEEIRASSGSLLVPASNLSSEPSLGSEEEEEEQEEEQENNGEESQDLEDISEDLDFYEAMKTPTSKI